MPVMASPGNGVHSIDGEFALYPWKNIFVREGAEVNGDGSKANPLNSLQQIFDDDGLECLCQSLCCDSITVFVAGEIMPPYEKGEENQPAEMLAIDGRGRDYAGKLHVTPWFASELKINVFRDFVLSGGESSVTSEKIIMTGIKNVSGVIFENVAINLQLTGTYLADEEEEKPVEIPDLRVYGRMICAEGLSNCAFPGSYLLAKTSIDIKTGIEYKTYRLKKEDDSGDSSDYPGWGGGSLGDGGGGGGGGSSPGWDSNAPDIPENEEDEETEKEKEKEDAALLGWDSGDVNVKITMRGFAGCNGADLTDAKTDIIADVQTSVGADIDGAGVVSSKEISCNSFICNCKSEILIEGGGAEYTKYDEDGTLVESGVERYSLMGRGILSGIMSSPDSSLAGVLCECVSVVTAIAINTPYSKDEKTGETQTFQIGGSSLAESFAFRACNRAKISLADSSCEAEAIHPVLWGQIARPYSSNVGADISGSTASEAYCLSSDVDFCK